MKKLFVLLLLAIPFNALQIIAQGVSKTMLRLPDTGQNTSYTTTFGEDNDYSINPPEFKGNGDGTVTDTVTGLMWQQTDGGEMTYENATLYCDSLTLGGYSDWRLPDSHEAFSIVNHQSNSPALDMKVFTKTAAEYWWTSSRQINDATKIWVINAGGGIGNHPKTETVSAGGIKKIHTRAMREVNAIRRIPNHFIDNSDGTITDNLTYRMWQKITPQNAMTWEEALIYAEGLTLAGVDDWRLPNIKELQSISDEGLMAPSVQSNYFTTVGVKKYWSSTSLPNQTTRAWYLNTQFGITTYDLKTVANYVICVRGSASVITSVEEDSENQLIEISPNPAHSEILVTCALGNSKTTHVIEIRNLLGELIFSYSIQPFENVKHISTESFENGLYFVSLISPSKRSTSKVIIYN